MTNLTFANAHQLAQMIREREVSSVEVLDAYLAQIAKHNSRLNAICTLDEGHARSRAKLADEALARGENWGALHGVPITIKDIFETEGLRTTAGYIPLKDYVPQQDATAVARLRAAGAVIVGKTNMAELAGDYQSTNSLFPRVNNPWNIEYTPGGSSGGSAAAVASGFSALDLGNDFAGSVRQPAHFCGVYGLKPTDRRISTAGTIPEVPVMPICLRQMMTVGCFARSLEDIRLCFSLIAGADIRRPDVPPIPLDTPSGKSWQNLKIAWIDQWTEVPVSRETKTAMNAIANKLAQTGAQIERWLPQNFDISYIINLYSRMAAYVNNYAQPKDRYNIRRSLELIFRTATQGDKQLRKLGDFSRFLPELLNPSLRGYFEALTERDRVTVQMDQALEPWDVWLVPVAATTAFTHRPAWSAVEIDGKLYPHGIANGAYTMPFNLSGHPAIVIPIGQTHNGLPMGMQIVGKRWREMEMLAIAQKIDNIIGGFKNPSSYELARNQE
ncbi:amidase [Aetokthonos hydrillicola Thurmond2011]|uniref:Amidase n=1 Tax=Aetokthonos hydrillicola Thurmond2011 TaxID=2712845 RepID=A0AAP5MCM0_9CYAN|nr:amidase [Aetokthonos hydrillicola]MBO3462009.1 amidase [Aetokthonos hydrillicola CCALA 1050]MBW4584288.1 amidase [Aetokthonos hydrillicola CCALA 1050]MDR9898503.1 amidase [Aetokthonos hydrillicola Thurmond2011]